MDQRRRRPGELLRPEGNGSYPGPQVAKVAVAPPLSPYFAEHVDGQSPSSGEPSPLGRGGRSSIPAREVGGSLQMRHIEAGTPCSSSCGRAPQAPESRRQGRYRGGDPPPTSGAPNGATLRGCPSTWFACCRRPGRSGEGGWGGEAKTLEAEAVTGQGAGRGARSPTPVARPGAADFRGKPKIVICPLVLTDLSWYSLSTIFQDPSHATEA